jgi:hypothetical protein
MNLRDVLKLALLISLLAPAPVRSQTSGRDDGMRFVPDVEGQFGSLAARPDPLGLHIGTSPNPSSCKHNQGLVRVDAADGTPYLLVTRSGNTPSVPGPDDIVCDDSPGETGNGHLIVYRMGSREKHGERMRSNRLAVGRHYDNTKPPAEDVAAVFFTFVHGSVDLSGDESGTRGLAFRDGDANTPRIYQHPGGMQLIGDVLAVAVENPRRFRPDCPILDPAECLNYDVAPDRTLIMFFEIGADPGAPKFLSQFVPKNAAGETLASAGTVAITPLADGHYLMLVQGGPATTLFFYRSTSTNLKNTSWTRVDSWSADPGVPINFDTCREDSVLSSDLDCLSPDEQYLGRNWPTVGATHQTLQFLRQGDIDGTLYLAGARGKFSSDDNSLDLYRIDCETPLCGENPDSPIRIKHIRTRHHSYFPNAGGEQLVNFAAASGFYVSPSGELLFYATEHDNDGPDGTVKAAEYRHIFMARDDSPTFGPTATVGGPFAVDEGGSASLTGSASPPITRPFIQLFDEIHDQNRFEGKYPVVDHPDYALDDFDDLSVFQVSIGFQPRGFYRTTRSWNWFAPIGCSVVANVEDIDDPTAEIETKTLEGTGRVEHDPDLREIPNDRGTDDMDEKVSSVAFHPSCDQYYSAAFDLQWDLDLDGSHETTGTTVTFDARGVDGPSLVSVPVQARHPSGGAVGQATASVTVHNVAPHLTPLRLTDGGGRQVNVDVPFVLTGQPVTAGAGFTDPGVLDHQSATLAWGDGSVDLETAFTTFDEAFGDATGAVSHSHRYLLAGSYPIELSVTDDDGGLDAETSIVRVVTPEQAVEEVVGLLDTAIAGTTDGDVRKELEEARKALAGSNSESNNGALDKIRAGNDQAAIAHLQQAIDHLRRAGAGGADVATLIAILEQVVAALSAA